MKPEDTSVKRELHFKWFYSEDFYWYNNDHWSYINHSMPLQLAVFPITVMQLSWWWV